MRPVLGALLLALLAAGCAGGSDDPADEASRPKPSPVVPSDPFGPPPATPGGPLSKQLAADLEAVFSNLGSTIDPSAVRRIGASKDARAAWLLSDLMRFVQTGAAARDLVRSFEQVTGTKLAAEERGPGRAWK